jgi:hypothetical protein
VAVRHSLHFCRRHLRRVERREDAVTDPLLCSAKGCQQHAVWALVWNNPKVHSPDRRKTWLACEEHREQLAGFLGARQFLLDVVPVDEAPQDPGPGR